MKKLMTMMLALVGASTALFADCDNVGDCCPEEPCCASRFHANAGYLYWWTCVDDLAFAVDVNLDRDVLYTNQDIFPAVIFGNGVRILPRKNLQDKKFITPSKRGHSGFRVGLGYDLSCSRTLFLNWSSFCPSLSKTVEPKIEDTTGLDFLVPFSGFPFGLELSQEFFGVDGTLSNDTSVSAATFSTATMVRAKWNLDLDFIDFGLSQEFQCGGCFLLTPHLDLRYISTKQRGRTDATIQQILPNLDSSSTVNPIFQKRGTGVSSIRSDFETKTRALGPRIGLDLDFDMGCSLDLFGRLATSLVYGENCTSLVDQVTAIPQDEPDPIIDPEGFRNKQRYDHHCVRQIFDLTIGVGYVYETCCYGRDFSLGLDLGWEYHRFVNMGLGQVDRTQEFCTADRPDLATQGLTVGVRAAF